MISYQNLNFSERLERVIEDIKNAEHTSKQENCRDFYHLFKEAKGFLNISENQLINIGIKSKLERFDFTLALLNIGNFAKENGNHLLDDSKILNKILITVKDFSVNLNDYLSQLDINTQNNHCLASVKINAAVEAMSGEELRAEFMELAAEADRKPSRSQDLRV